MQEFSFTPIGTVRCGGKYKSEAPRQGIYSSSEAVIELDKIYAGEALSDLQGFERIWIIFVFHHNLEAKWKARVLPPYTPEKRRYSLFATRSPYRPNPIGISCVTLDCISGSKLFISNHDLLDNTPVLDIKPYIPQVDAFPDSRAGWRDELPAVSWELEFTGIFSQKSAFLTANGAPDMENFAKVQLSWEPLDFSRRRIYPLDNGDFELGCRTWRLQFQIDPATAKVKLLDIRSNYSAAELAPDAADKYGDKELHRKFISAFDN